MPRSKKQSSKSQNPKKFPKRRKSKPKSKVRSAVGMKSLKKSSSQSNVTTSAKPIPPPPPPPLPPASKFRKLVKTHKKKHCPKNFKGEDYEMPKTKPTRKDTLSRNKPNLKDGRWVCITFRNRDFAGASQVFNSHEWFWLSEEEQNELGIESTTDYYKYK